MKQEVQDAINRICDIREDGSCLYGRALEVTIMPCCKIRGSDEMCMHYREGEDAENYCAYKETAKGKQTQCCPKECDEFICPFIFKYVEFSKDKKLKKLFQAAKEDKRKTIKEKQKRREFSGNEYPKREG